MQIKKVMPVDEKTSPASYRFTQEQLQVEFNYIQAEKVMKKLLEEGLVTLEEFNKIMAENRRTFPIIFAPLY